MRRIIFQCHFAIMGMNDGLAERKPKPKTSAAVANRIAPGKEHFKNTFLQFIWDTGTVIADAYFGHIFSRDCRDPDVRASRSIFDCVVHQVDKHLHDESCIHPHQQRYPSDTDTTESQCLALVEDTALLAYLQGCFDVFDVRK